ncbi:hypothetical protein N7540_001270 [Penicillium herquei]|nr:hypothetical protein N7540_001270 [Penicillium herquei]
MELIHIHVNSKPKAALSKFMQAKFGRSQSGSQPGEIPSPASTPVTDTSPASQPTVPKPATPLSSSPARLATPATEAPVISLLDDTDTAPDDDQSFDEYVARRQQSTASDITRARIDHNREVRRMKADLTRIKLEMFEILYNMSEPEQAVWRQRLNI